MAAKKISKFAGRWKPGEGGYETTKSTGIIKMTLANIKKKRSFVVLMQKGYQSGSTIVVDFNNKYLMIDKPVDWSSTIAPIRVVFKDETLVWNHFSVKVVGESKNTLKTLIPTELFRLQRRSHFRIGLPPGSEASFMWKELNFFNKPMVDISVGGMGLRCDREYSIVDGGADDSISNIVLEILPGPDDPSGEKFVINIQKGRIVREVYDEQKHCLLAGVMFLAGSNEEKDLMQFIRQRELEILRKGIK